MFAHNFTEPRLKQAYLWALEKVERAAEREFDEQRHEVRAKEQERQELETKLEGEQLSRINKQH
jgi:hypothetical protein